MTFYLGHSLWRGGLLVLLSLSRRSGFMPEQIQDMLLAAASMASSGLHIVLRLLSFHLCNEHPSLPKKQQKSRWDPFSLTSLGTLQKSA